MSKAAGGGGGNCTAAAHAHEQHGTGGNPPVHARSGCGPRGVARCGRSWLLERSRECLGRDDEGRSKKQAEETELASTLKLLPPEDEQKKKKKNTRRKR